MKKITCKDCEHFDLNTKYVSTEVHLCKRYNISKYGDETCHEIGCDYCNPNGDDCHIYKDPMSGDFYMEVRANNWDKYNDDYDYVRVYINNCPMCGRKLKEN